MTDQTSNAAIRARIKALLPEIAERAQEIEDARRVPLDLVERLRAAGAFRMNVPKRLGGAEFPLVEMLEALEDIATADGSTGWTVSIAAETPRFLGPMKKPAFDAFYAKSPDIVLAGSTAPTGKAERVDGGWRITGRWPWGSGCLHADWLVGNCIVMENGKPKDSRIPGRAMLRQAVFPASQATIHDTWRVSGLKGTGSNDFSVEGVIVPDECTFDMWTEETHSREACLLPLFITGGMTFGALAVGMAQGAVNDVVELAKAGKQRAFSALRSAEQPVFQYRLGQAETKVRVARAALHTQARLVDDSAEALPRAFALVMHPLTKQTQATSAYVSRLAFEAIDTLYEIAGGSSVHEKFPLQRRLRDVRALTQHLALTDTMYQRHGGGLVGVEVML